MEKSLVVHRDQLARNRLEAFMTRPSRSIYDIALRSVQSYAWDFCEANALPKMDAFGIRDRYPGKWKESFKKYCWERELVAYQKYQADNPAVFVLGPDEGEFRYLCLALDEGRRDL